jgi:hypothetical protein
VARVDDVGSDREEGVARVDDRDLEVNDRGDREDGETEVDDGGNLGEGGAITGSG